MLGIIGLLAVAIAVFMLLVGLVGSTIAFWVVGLCLFAVACFFFKDRLGLSQGARAVLGVGLIVAVIWAWVTFIV